MWSQRWTVSWLNCDSLLLVLLAITNVSKRGRAATAKTIRSMVDSRRGSYSSEMTETQSSSAYRPLERLTEDSLTNQGLKGEPSLWWAWRHCRTQDELNVHSLLKSIVKGTRDGRFHKDNLRHLSRFPDFFVFKRILSAKIWTLVAVGLVFFFKRLIH